MYIETVRIYNNKEINSFDELIELMSSGVPACFDSPEKERCECEKCIEYKITIERIGK